MNVTYPIRQHLSEFDRVFNNNCEIIGNLGDHSLQFIRTISSHMHKHIYVAATIITTTNLLFFAILHPLVNHLNKDLVDLNHKRKLLNSLIIGGSTFTFNLILSHITHYPLSKFIMTVTVITAIATHLFFNQQRIEKKADQEQRKKDPEVTKTEPVVLTKTEKVASTEIHQVKKKVAITKPLKASEEVIDKELPKVAAEVTGKEPPKAGEEELYPEIFQEAAKVTSKEPPKAEKEVDPEFFPEDVELTSKEPPKAEEEVDPEFFPEDEEASGIELLDREPFHEYEEESSDPKLLPEEEYEEHIEETNARSLHAGQQRNVLTYSNQIFTFVSVGAPRSSQQAIQTSLAIMINICGEADNYHALPILDLQERSSDYITFITPGMMTDSVMRFEADGRPGIAIRAYRDDKEARVQTFHQRYADNAIWVSLENGLIPVEGSSVFIEEGSIEEGSIEEDPFIVKDSVADKLNQLITEGEIEITTPKYKGKVTLI